MTVTLQRVGMYRLGDGQDLSITALRVPLSLHFGIEFQDLQSHTPSDRQMSVESCLWGSVSAGHDFT
jgi:hypothetical protein